MENSPTPEERRALAKALEGIGIKQSYASLIAHGRRTPSLKLALKIEENLGIPPSRWPLEASERGIAANPVKQAGEAA